MIADGTLKPGDPAPSGPALAGKTGYHALTCRGALRVLLQDGTLTRGMSQKGRLRVAGASPAGGAGPAALGAALGAALAERRRALGLTQPQLAALLGVPLTTVGHAETGRAWQAREFWKRAGAFLGDGGALLRMYDEYRAASRAAAQALVTWPDGTETLATPPGCQERAEVRQSGE
jgi:hypothetical protein